MQLKPVCRQTVEKTHDENSCGDWQQQQGAAAAWQHQWHMQEYETVHTSHTGNCIHHTHATVYITHTQLYTSHVTHRQLYTSHTIWPSFHK